MSRTISIILVSTFIIFTSGCATHSRILTKKVKGAKDYRQLPDTIEDTRVTKLYIQTIGIGAPDESLPKTQRRATSREAAIAASQFNMLSIVKGIRIKGHITVEKAMEKDSHIVSTVDNLFRGARIVRTEWLEDDGCLVTLQLDFEGNLAKRLGITRDIRSFTR